MANESPPPATRRRTSERRRERDRNIQACFRTALPHTKLVISGEIKSLLFYEPVVNQEYIAKEERTGVRDILILDYLQWIMVIVIGTAAGIFCTLFQIVIYNIDTYNRDFVTKLIEDNSSKTNLLLYWFGYTIIPTLVSSLLVVFVEPIAEGGGIESIIAFLNGLAIPKYGHFLAIIVKYFSSLVLLIGNLPGGSVKNR